MSLEKRYARLIFTIGFLFVLTTGGLVQTVVIPYFLSGMNNGTGLIIASDGALYHQAAVDEYNKIKSEGWSHWTLCPTENKLIVSGILSFLYSFFGTPSSLLFLPITALVHAVSVLLMFKILRMCRLNMIPAFIGACVFAIIPASWFWTLQLHKEGFYILGVLLVCFSILRTFLGETQRITIFPVVALISGIVLIWGVRPYLVDVFALGLFSCGVVRIFQDGFNRSCTILPFVLIAIAIGAFFLPQFYEGAAMPDVTLSNEPQIAEPGFTVFRQLSSCRDYFLEQYATATLVIDPNVRFATDLDLIGYVPRAVLIGLVAPLGFCSLSVGSFFFGMHCVLFLLCLASMAVWIFKNRLLWLPFICLVFLFGLEMVLRVLVTPNAGSLWRYLFAGKGLAIAFGIAVITSWISTRWQSRV